MQVSLKSQYPFPRFNHAIKPLHSCPYCKCFSKEPQFDFNRLTCQPHAPRLVDELHGCNKPITKILTLRGQNVQRHKIIISRSISPYPKKITITYQSPNNRNCYQPNLQKTIGKNHRGLIFQSQSAQEVRPKILDKKKKREKQKNVLISFKSVKSASTDLFLETPLKEKDKGEKQHRNGSTDQTNSIKSLSRVSIDERFFQF